jgi:dTDP-4-dehydrorhamnose reductase
MKRYLITGVSGLLGINFAMRLKPEAVLGVVNQNWMNGAPFDQLRIDLTHNDAIQQVIESYKPDVVINCAAMANVDICETQPELADKINAEVPGLFAEVCRKNNIKYVHISTDAVFDGTKENGFYSEQDEPNPNNVYSKTKLAGEEAVKSANDQAIIARVNFYGWSVTGKRSLSEWFFHNLSSGKTINGFEDVFYCPLMVSDLVDVLIKMVNKNLYGLYHVVGSTCLSKYDFGMRLAKKFGFDPDLITPISWKDAGLTAKRSSNLKLSIEKLEKDLQEPIPGVETGLERFYQQYQSGYADAIYKMGQA